jgi:hypothetical protein
MKKEKEDNIGESNNNDDDYTSNMHTGAKANLWMHFVSLTMGNELKLKYWC